MSLRRERIPERKGSFKKILKTFSARDLDEDIFTSISQNDLKRIKRFLNGRSGPEIMLSRNEEGLTPFGFAIKLKKVELVKLFLAWYEENPKININETDKMGYSIVHTAAIYGTDTILCLILSLKKISVTVKNRDFNTPLHFFCHHYSSPNIQEPFELMIKKGAKLDEKNSNGETPLHKAVFNSTVRLLIVDQLLKSGANINIQTRRGYTALHYGVRLRRRDLVSVLLKNGADPRIKEESGRTALDFATESKFHEIEKLLKRAQDVYLWLEEIELVQYAKNFMKEEIYLEILADENFTEQNLISIGINIVGHRIKIFQASKKINQFRSPQRNPRISSYRFPNDCELNFSDFSTSHPSLIIEISDIEFTEQIGSGAASTVFKGLLQQKIDVAIKMMRDIEDLEVLNEVKKEIEIMSGLKHPHIIRFYGICFEPKLCMVMEYCARNSLFHFLNEKIDFKWNLFFKFSKQIAGGIHFLHSQDPPIVHRDIKTLNILVTRDLTIKISDFGLSRFVQVSNLETLRQFKGTPIYTSPELMNGGSFTTKSDTYGMAIVFWEMINRCIKGKYEKPFSEYTEIILEVQLISTINCGKRPTVPSKCPPSLAKLIEQGWNQDPEQRLNASDFSQILEKIETQEYQPNQQQWISLL